MWMMGGRVWYRVALMVLMLICESHHNDRNKVVVFASYAGSASAIIDPSKVKQVSWKPRAFVYEGFLSELECDHLISIARSELKRSAVADNLSGESKLSQVRTSSGMFIPKNKLLYRIP